MSTVLITGTSSGFGKMAALQFARKGDNVFASMRNTAMGAELEQIARKENVALKVVQLDVLSDDSVAGAVKQVLGDAGSIDVLVNNAGFEIRGAVEEISDEEARAQFDTNVFGLLRVTRAVLPHMRSRGSGRIINVSSVAGIVGVPFGGIYAASKHAVEALTETMYWELHPFGISVCLIEPGAFPTEFSANIQVARAHESGIYKQTAEEFRNRVGRLAPGGEPQDPNKVADAIYNAAYDESLKLRYPVGGDANLIVGAYKQMDFEGFSQAMRQALDWWD
ncbi:MAG TPA: SDR family oxidoreductase [Dehalococcoidia bacterium]|nr:SDR family oxidoreductase [Dehalococcoidia bacterium]